MVDKGEDFVKSLKFGSEDKADHCDTSMNVSYTDLCDFYKVTAARFTIGLRNMP